MTLLEKISALSQLGQHLQMEDEYLDALCHRSFHENNWFTIENIKLAIRSIATSFLAPDQLNKWLVLYKIPETKPILTVGLVLAGNIPLVGFHDLLCVFVAGHKAQIKLSDKDKYLLPYLVKLLNHYQPGVAEYFEFVEVLKGFDAVIATGSNNSSRYFEAYFGKYPHLIRGNRNAVAVLTGQETPAHLIALGQDVFQYFGLGCRSVAKLYLPKQYDFTQLLEIFHEYKEVVLHSKFKNNFDYNYALLIMNNEKFLANGCVLLIEKESIQSRISTLHYEFYENFQDISEKLNARAPEIQCIVGNNNTKLQQKLVAFGHSQRPALWDYADGVDTLDFLLRLT